MSYREFDVAAAARFMTTHARVLERHRFAMLFGPDRDGAVDNVVTALDAYRNPDGGYGWGLEPDLRDTTSQPVGAMHAFEVFEEIAHATLDGVPSTVVDRARSLCDWLASVSLADGGLPFACAVRDPTGCAPWWAGADTTTSSLHITSAVAAKANRVALHVPAVRDHEWLRAATSYCLAQIAARDRAAHAIELEYIIELLDAVHDREPDAAAHLARLGATIPPSGVMPVEGGVEGEVLRPLDFAPLPDRPARRLFDPATVDAELARLASEQRDDGGWPVEWATVSPASAIEWRGMLTVKAVTILTAGDRPAGP